MTEAPAMNPDDGLATKIAELIEGHRAGGAAHEWQRKMACRHGALAVYGDIGGADGAVVAEADRQIHLRRSDVAPELEHDNARRLFDLG